MSLLNHSRAPWMTPRVLFPTPARQECSCYSNPGLLRLPGPKLKLSYPHQTKLCPVLEDLQTCHCGFYRSPLDIHLLFVYVIFKDVIIIRTTGINTLGTNTADSQRWENKCSGVLAGYPSFWVLPWTRASMACFTGRMENSHTLREQMTEGKKGSAHQFSIRLANDFAFHLSQTLQVSEDDRKCRLLLIWLRKR